LAKITPIFPFFHTFVRLSAVLSLRGNLLTTLPSEIGLLSNLTELGLRSNRLTSLPPGIGLLSNLGIDLPKNNLTGLFPKQNLTALFLNYERQHNCLTSPDGDNATSQQEDCNLFSLHQQTIAHYQESPFGNLLTIGNVQVGHQSYSVTLRNPDKGSYQFVLDEIIELVGYARPLNPATYDVNNFQQVNIPAVFVFGKFWRIVLQYEPENNVFSLLSAVELSE
jgi:hypothetical protein